MDIVTALDFSGKVALVTGASRGIGEAIARALAERGATVVLSSRKAEELERVRSAIASDGGRAIVVPCNTGEPEQIGALFERIDAEAGRLDIVVNNAAANPYSGPVADTPEWAFDKTVAVNVKGYFLVCQHAVRRMTAARSGAIVNVASIAAFAGLPGQTVYAMTKAAVVSLTRSLAKEVGPYGVRVNAVAPGVVRTRFSEVLTENPEVAEPLRRMTALGRFGEPEEIVGAVLYLASGLASYTTGTVVVCDGGALA